MSSFYLVSHEVEPGEGLLLLLQIVVERLLAALDGLVQLVKNFLAALGDANLDCVGLLRGFKHQLLPLRV
jgi:hypothetical protein